jgi:hypothetical protein
MVIGSFFFAVALPVCWVCKSLQVPLLRLHDAE